MTAVLARMLQTDSTKFTESSNAWSVN